MEQAGIIEKKDGPTDLDLVQKNDGKLRICVNPRKTNGHVKMRHYQLPKRGDMEAELAGANPFRCLNSNSGFHQIPLDQRT